MNKQIYRGYDIEEKRGDSMPFKVSKDGNFVYAAHSEDDAYSFIDQSKRELAAAKK